eukprot:151317-Chlamydomonas_euryale.AAC.10
MGWPASMRAHLGGDAPRLAIIGAGRCTTRASSASQPCPAHLAAACNTDGLGRLRAEGVESPREQRLRAAALRGRRQPITVRPRHKGESPRSSGQSTPSDPEFSCVSTSAPRAATGKCGGSAAAAQWAPALPRAPDIVPSLRPPNLANQAPLTRAAQPAWTPPGCEASVRCARRRVGLQS